jgi:hypothetical protein
MHVEPLFWNVCFIQLMHSPYHGMVRMAEEVAKLKEEAEMLKQENYR